MKLIKRIAVGILSILGMSTLFWILFLLNPSLSYAHQTKFGQVTVFHNQELEKETASVIEDALEIIQKSKLYDEGLQLELCLNDDEIYPNLNVLVGQSIAYALFNKVIIKNCEAEFSQNMAEFQWAINDHETRRYNLTWLLAHEFTHSLQYHAHAGYVIKSTLGKFNWKLEGHAEYISRQFTHDRRLKDKILKYREEANKEHLGIPVFELEDGTKQSLSYYKYALLVQYLMEEKKLDFMAICELETELAALYQEMIVWSES